MNNERTNLFERSDNQVTFFVFTMKAILHKGPCTMRKTEQTSTKFYHHSTPPHKVRSRAWSSLCNPTQTSFLSPISSSLTIRQRQMVLCAVISFFSRSLASLLPARSLSQSLTLVLCPVIYHRFGYLFPLFDRGAPFVSLALWGRQEIGNRQARKASLYSPNTLLSRTPPLSLVCSSRYAQKTLYILRTKRCTNAFRLFCQ